jgi:hypothetical protein
MWSSEQFYLRDGETVTLQMQVTPELSGAQGHLYLSVFGFSEVVD